MTSDPMALLGVPLERARTLPGHWYADPAHHERELEAVFRRGWVGAGCADDVAAPGSYVVTSAGGLPVLVVRDDAGDAAGVPQHVPPPGSPLADGCGRAPRAVVPVPRLGVPARRLAGQGRWRRQAGRLRPGRPRAAAGARHDVRPLDHGQRRPRRGAVRPRPARCRARAVRASTSMELGERTRYERHFNWKVLLENYCENYHTPFIHSQLPTGGYEYPIECAGPAVIAWDRPLATWRRVRAGAARSPSGRRRLGRRRRRGGRRLVQQRHLPRGVPEHGDLLLRRLRRDVPLTPAGPATTVVEREYYWHPDVPPAAPAPPTWPPPGEVVEQDLRMCERLQRTYDAGLSADGVLSTAARGRRRPHPSAACSAPLSR